MSKILNKFKKPAKGEGNLIYCQSCSKETIHRWDGERWVCTDPKHNKKDQ